MKVLLINGLKKFSARNNKQAPPDNFKEIKNLTNELNKKQALALGLIKQMKMKISYDDQP